MRKIIDVHAHYGAWFFPIRRLSEADILNIMRERGVEKAILSSSLAVVYDIVEGNRELKQLVDRNAELYGYVVLNPNYPELSEVMIEEFLSDEKFVGAKIHSDYTGQPVSSEANMKLLELVRRRRKVVLLHTWGEPGIEATSKVAETFPDLNLIMAHMGGNGREGWGWKLGIRAAKKKENIFLEVCGSELHKDRIAEAVRELGKERILFGSDMTLISPDFAIGMILEADIPEDAKEAIFYYNAKRLFRF